MPVWKYVLDVGEHRRESEDLQKEVTPELVLRDAQEPGEEGEIPFWQKQWNKQWFPR